MPEMLPLRKGSIDFRYQAGSRLILSHRSSEPGYQPCQIESSLFLCKSELAKGVEFLGALYLFKHVHTYSVLKVLEFEQN